jgi:hypothetical protein
MGLTLSTNVDIVYIIENQKNATGNTFLVNASTGGVPIDLTEYITADTIDYTGGTTSNISIPSWCRHIAVILIGGGGGGGYGNASGYGAGGGAGAALASNAISVLSGTTYSITVGAGGTGGIYSSSTVSVSGGNTSLTITIPSQSNIVLTAGGGVNGQSAANPSTGGSGGNITGSPDYIKASINGTRGSNGRTSAGDGGGRTTSLNNSSTTTPYCADFTASGGAGSPGNNNPGNGTEYGGGGGGGALTAFRSGGNGANGFARVYFYL